MTWLSYRFSSIPLILKAHQLVRWSLVLIKCVPLDSIHKILAVIHKISGVLTHSNMEMGVEHQAIMCPTYCILIHQLIINLCHQILQLPLCLGETTCVFHYKFLTAIALHRSLQLLKHTPELQLIWLPGI